MLSYLEFLLVFLSTWMFGFFFNIIFWPFVFLAQPKSSGGTIQSVLAGLQALHSQRKNCLEIGSYLTLLIFLHLKAPQTN